ncbi:pilin outer membrane usher protein SafC [Pantoea ananatis]|uniref:fimbria/pilus outer membrane usher protein n=1 Tax=Pantoea ananas TaxID=553 RepID=UPI0007364A1D|nr:fimbria/pilus outer membrane usher protein [Pantoea ananatis]KTR45707.1 pilin outer membrane usher protein SafC [Pantoea ananatis]KTR52204.1 pilin outer membrane usher protein SafC [Pantoea ananatis]KTR62178.1 pilin outer membrane usher protein SafC [Pantoea ananatis]KTR68395.1 pilin outer membrane usher protein SafC [Pantoea ananatis]
MRRTAFIAALPVACFTSGAAAQQYHFDASLLGGAAKNADLSLFEQGLQQPGTYRMDVLLNGEQVDSQDITLRLVKAPSGDSLQPCLSVAQLLRWGVNTAAWPALAESGKACARLSAIPQAQVKADVAALQLRLDIPQAALRPHYGGLAPEALWDNGITAFRMNYSAATSRTYGQPGGPAETSWAQIQPGINAGPWRVRSSLSWKSHERWQRSYAWAERGFVKIKSRLTLGERTTSADVLDGVPFSGVMLATDETMIPANERGYTPVVRGVARTRARIEIRQHGYLLKMLQVAPGPFSIEDLPAGQGGDDLQVTVYEADGHNQFFTVPWQTPAVALHEGYLRYSVAAGRYRPTEAGVASAPLVQATLMYGLPRGLTLYGGLQGAADYSGASLGLGSSLGRWGAVSADATKSRARTPHDGTSAGTAWRVRYNSQLGDTTGIVLSSVQYTSPGYRSMTDTLDRWRSDGYSPVGYAQRSVRGRSMLQLSQTLGAAGGLGLNVTRTDWRGGSRPDYGYGASWSASLYGASVSLSWQQSRTGTGCRDSLLSLWLSVPLGQSTSGSWSLTAPHQGAQAQEVALSGRAVKDQLDWSVRESYRPGSGAGPASGSLHAGWAGTYGTAAAGYSYGASDRQADVSVAGGVIAHRHGVTFSQPLSDTVALVSAPGAADVAVGGEAGVSTDWRGYTAVSGLADYQDNTVSLDPTTLSDDADVPQTDVRVVPAAGAVVMAAFRTRTGARALVTLQHPNGTPVPFGAQVSVAGQAGSAGLADGSGQAFLTGLPPAGRLMVRSGSERCQADYRLPGEKGRAGLYTFSAVCRRTAQHGEEHE